MTIQRILIAEDDMIIQMYLSLVLTKAGYTIVGEARNSEQVLRLAKEKEPDLIILDIGLDGSVDGIDTAEELTQFCRIPFLFLTGNSDESTIKRAKLAGPIGFVFKPIDEVRLVDVIKSL
ncbi:MAG: DNA-binding NarL/FixJ family response regulator [Crocinitomicaceae bacterium]|jgi:DNA-binding NarL/FixJ family response regulator